MQFAAKAGRFPAYCVRGQDMAGGKASQPGKGGSKSIVRLCLAIGVSFWGVASANAQTKPADVTIISGAGTEVVSGPAFLKESGPLRFSHSPLSAKVIVDGKTPPPRDVSGWMHLPPSLYWHKYAVSKEQGVKNQQ